MFCRKKPRVKLTFKYVVWLRSRFFPKIESLVDYFYIGSSITANPPINAAASIAGKFFGLRLSSTTPIPPTD